MASKKIDPSRAKASFSLISDDKFRRILGAMVRLRARRGKDARPRNIEAVVAGASVDLEAGDLIFAEAGLFPSETRALGTIADGVTIYSYAKKEDALPAMSTGAAMGLRAAGGHGVVVVFCSADVQSQKAWRSSFLKVAQQRLPILIVLIAGGTDDERAVARTSAEAMDAGVIAVPVDAADAVAIYRVAFESLIRARRRTGATAIVATRYVVEGESRKASDSEDPVARMKVYLKSRGVSLSGKKRQ